MGVSFIAAAATTSTTLLVGGSSNLLSVVNGFAKVSSITVVGTTNAANVNFYDTTGALTFGVGAYTNTVSYLTNVVYSVTNYIGAVTTLTNLQLIDNTVNLVAATTNAVPMKLSTYAAAGTAVNYTGVDYAFQQGIFVTNTGTGSATVIIKYAQ